jgi:hypothetical protein
MLVLVITIIIIIRALKSIALGDDDDGITNKGAADGNSGELTLGTAVGVVEGPAILGTSLGDDGITVGAADGSSEGLRRRCISYFVT